MNYFKGKVGPALIAEIGGNHEGDFEYAKELTQLAISTDVDFIKFQLYTGDSLVSKIESGSRNKHFKKFELTKTQHLELAQMVADAGINYMASVWDLDMIDWINDYMPVYKIGSGDLTAYPIIKKITGKGKPIVLSTGLSTEREVMDTIKYIQLNNQIYNSHENLAILQCTSMYPIKSNDANLSVMQRFSTLTNLTVGYSDHTEGVDALQISVAMGAQILEFHFTDSREGKECRDHKVSLIPDEVRMLKDRIKLIQTLKGRSKKEPLAIEIENNHVQSFRRAIYPIIDIKKGTIITPVHLTVLRPNNGIDARDYYKLLGKKATTNIRQHDQLDWTMFE